MVTIHDTPQNSDDWLKARIGKFTASNAIELLKHGRVDRARVVEKEFAGNQWTRRGHDLEPFAVTAYEQVKEVSVKRPGYITNDKYKDCLFSPDGLTDTHVIEIKCFNETRHHKVRKTIPPEILAQIHFGMIMAELSYAHLVLFNPDLEPKDALFIVSVKKDTRLTKRLISLMKGGENE